MRAEPVFRSPIGIMIHPEFGLWHVYRAVLLFAEYIDLPAWSAVENPCDACEAKPCRKVCPADAFTPSRFDAFLCFTRRERGGTKLPGTRMSSTPRLSRRTPLPLRSISRSFTPKQ